MLTGGLLLTWRVARTPPDREYRITGVEPVGLGQLA